MAACRYHLAVGDMVGELRVNPALYACEKAREMRAASDQAGGTCTGSAHSMSYLQTAA
jgi:hypothetical protein